MLNKIYVKLGKNGHDKKVMEGAQIKRASKNAHTGSSVSHTSIAMIPNTSMVTEKIISVHFTSRIDVTNRIWSSTTNPEPPCMQT